MNCNSFKIIGETVSFVQFQWRWIWYLYCWKIYLKCVRSFKRASVVCKRIKQDGAFHWRFVVAATATFKQGDVESPGQVLICFWLQIRIAEKKNKSQYKLKNNLASHFPSMSTARFSNVKNVNALNCSSILIT